MAGCSAKKTEPSATAESTKAPVVNTEPVTLKIMAVNTAVTKEEFEQFISNPIKLKYPYITVEYVEAGVEGSLKARIASGQANNIPDIVLTDYSNLSTVLDLEYAADLTDAMKKDNVNLNQMETSALEGVRALGAKGQLYGLPIYLDKYMMFYNKGIFDRFAVPYPSDDMTYEDLMNLLKKVHRMDNGVQYIGYRWADLYTFGYQFGLPVINAKTGKADLQTAGWKNALSFVKEMIDMGMAVKPSHDSFFKGGTMAIYPQWMAAAYGLFNQAGKDLNWEMAAMPYSKDKPRISGPAKPIYLMASTVSKNKEQAIKAIAYVTTSPDVQMLLSQQGRISSLKNTDIQKQFGTKLELLKGKNSAAVFKYPFGTLPNTTSYEAQAWDGLDTAPVNVAKGIDVNTALRMAEEAANKKVDEFLSSKK